MRDDSVRAHFHQIIWLPLGQTPVIEKLQSIAHEQLTGKKLDISLDDEGRHKLLRQAFKGKKVLLTLDDCWEESHRRQLNFVDASCGGRVLISTRIRQVLQSAAFEFEIGKPSMHDSISMLMRAAGISASSTRAPPAGAHEIAQLCGCLPLALNIAGKLVRDLGFEQSDNWEGVQRILREELREHMTAEQGVIWASLAGLKGSSIHVTGARKLFKLFGLVPEDTWCPLEFLQMMYDAVYKTNKSTSIYNIRRWLQMLIDRSLVLGTVDRASLRKFPHVHLVSGT